MDERGQLMGKDLASEKTSCVGEAGPQVPCCLCGAWGVSGRVTHYQGVQPRGKGISKRVAKCHRCKQGLRQNLKSKGVCVCV